MIIVNYIFKINLVKNGEENSYFKRSNLLRKSQPNITRVNYKFIISVASLIGIFVHSFFYQKYYKHMDLKDPLQTFFIFTKLFIINDIIYTFTKYFSLSKINTRLTKILFNFLVPIVLLYLNLSALWSLEVVGYTKTFTMFKWIWVIMNMIKIIFIHKKKSFVVDLIKLFDTIWLVNMILILITDPITNTETNPNLVTFYEVYFNYLEFHILILASILIYNDKNIEDDVEYSENSASLFSTSALLGKHDSYRFSVILLFGHYYFVLVNCLSYGLR